MRPGKRFYSNNIRIQFVLFAIVIAFIGIFEGSNLYEAYLTNLMDLYASNRAPQNFLEFKRNLTEICPKPLANPVELVIHPCSKKDRCYLQGILALSSGNWTAAQANLSISQHFLSDYFLGWAAWCNGKPDRAIQAWYRYGSNLSERIRFIGEDFFYTSNNPQAALPWLALSNDLNPASAKTLTLMGIIYEQLGELESAIEHYKMAIETGNASGQAYTGAAEVEYRLGQTLQAKQNIQSAIQLEPNEWLNWQIYGNLLLDENNPSEAEVWYRKVISTKPDYAHAYATLSIAVLKQGKSTESLQPILEAMNLVQDLDKKAEYLEIWLQAVQGGNELGEMLEFLEQTWVSDSSNIDLLTLIVRAEYLSGHCLAAAHRFAQLEFLAQSQGSMLPIIDQTCP